MDDTVKHLARLLRSGAITPQTYVEGLSALAETPPIPAQRQRPTPASRRRRLIPAPRDVPSPDMAEMDAYIEEIYSEMLGERPIPAPRRRRPIPARPFTDLDDRVPHPVRLPAYEPWGRDT